MICRKCGKEIADEAVVCVHCGNTIAETSSQSLSAVNVVQSTPKKKKIIIYCVVILVIALVIALQVARVIVNNNTSVENQSAEYYLNNADYQNAYEVSSGADKMAIFIENSTIVKMYKIYTDFKDDSDKFITNSIDIDSVYYNNADSDSIYSDPFYFVVQGSMDIQSSTDSTVHTDAPFLYEFTYEDSKWKITDVKMENDKYYVEDEDSKYLDPSVIDRINETINSDSANEISQITGIEE